MEYDVADLSIAFNEGHNDGWGGKAPRPAPNGCLTDAVHQRYREGHAAGIAARYWYDQGYKAGRGEGF